MTTIRFRDLALTSGNGRMLIKTHFKCMFKKGSNTQVSAYEIVEYVKLCKVAKDLRKLFFFFRMQGSYFLGKKNLEIKKKNYDGSDMPIRHSLCHSSVQKRRRRKVFQ